MNGVVKTNNEKQDIHAENVFIRSEIERLGKDKKRLENEERILKKILNIEEEHRKHGSIIASGIRKLFGIRVKEQRYKEAVSQDFAKNIHKLR